MSNTIDGQILTMVLIGVKNRNETKILKIYQPKNRVTSEGLRNNVSINHN